MRTAQMTIEPIPANQWGVIMRNGFACSELESIILAMLAQGVTSGYAMRKQMSRMSGGRWSTESGSIYRALKRLEDAKLIREAGKGGSPRRQRTEYALSPEGMTLVKSWLSATPSLGDLETIADSIRARTYFLGLLDPDQQRQTVRTWISQNKDFVDHLRMEIDRNADAESPHWKLAQLNLLALAEARQDWLKRVIAALNLK